MCTLTAHNSLIIKAFLNRLPQKSICVCVFFCGRARELAWVIPGPRLELWSHSRGPKSATLCTDLCAAHLCACGVC